MLTLGQKIKAIRKEKGLTQAELVGDRITRNQLSLIENGINNPSISTLNFIASRLNVPMSYFLSNDDFSLHKCQKLITKCEALVDSEDYATVIKEIEEFLKNVNPESESTMDDLLGPLYTLLGIAQYNLDRSKAKATFQSAIKYLEGTDQNSYLSKAFNNLGLIFFEEENLTEADQYFTKAYNLISNVSLENLLLKLNIAYNMSFIYLHQKKYVELIDFINENLKYSKKYKIFHNFGLFNMLISIAYRYVHNYKQAILCTMKAIEYFQFSDEESSKYNCYINLGIWYRLVDDYDNSMNYLDMAKKYFEYTEKFSKATNAKAEMAKTMFLADKRGENYERLLNDILSELNNTEENKIDILTIKGICLLENNDIEGALNAFTEAVDKVENPLYQEFIAYAYVGLSKIHKHNQEWEKAYIYLDRANELPHKAVKNINFE